MIKPRIFVGTMYCCEGDYPWHLNAIKSQINVDITHKVIFMKNEIDAHNELWDSWNAVKHTFDLFVKIDADTVLANEKILSYVWSVFVQNKDVTGIQANLYDYFTDSKIFGLNCFSPFVEFLPSKNSLYCDRGVDTNHKVTIRGEQLPPELNIAGYHCKHATLIQSFHYGVHRALKNQSNIHQSLNHAYKVHGGINRQLALKGFEYANQLKNHFDYTDSVFLNVFDDVCKNQLIK